MAVKRVGERESKSAAIAGPHSCYSNIPTKTKFKKSFEDSRWLKGVMNFPYLEFRGFGLGGGEAGGESKQAPNAKAKKAGGMGFSV